MNNTTELPPLGAVLFTGEYAQNEYRRGLVIGILPVNEERQLVVIEDPVKFRNWYGHGLFLVGNLLNGTKGGPYFLDKSRIENHELGLRALRLSDIPPEYQDQWKPEFELENGWFCGMFHRVSEEGVQKEAEK